jgi:hypothetical protein
MSIKVICPGCLKRFQVSDQFAGRKGPCPKCKVEILIPKTSEDVVVHAPDNYGPKDSKGRSVLKPIFRQETRISMPELVVIGLTILGSLIAALILRYQYAGNVFPYWPLILGAVAMAVPLTLAGYAVLRDPELQPHSGQELYIRIGLCALLYALTWIAFPGAELAFREYSVTCIVIAVVIMMGIGGGIAVITLELDYFLGVIHFGLYFAACVLLRWIASGAALPLVS